MAESILFHVSTLLVSSPSFVKLDIDSELWEWIETILQKPAYENLTPSAGHPVLGTPRRLNKLVFEISKSSMRVPLRASDLPKLERFDVELAQWEAGEEGLEGHRICTLSDDPYIEVRRLYIVCARILLLNIENAGIIWEVAAKEDQVRRQIKKALEIIGDMEDTASESWNFLMRWPLRVLSHVVQCEQDRSVIRASLQRIWFTSACGDVQRSLDGINRLSELDADSVAEICYDENTGIFNEFQ